MVSASRAAEYAAEERGGIPGPEGAAGLTRLRKRIAIEHRGRRTDSARHAEEDRGNEVGHRRGRRHPEQQLEGGEGIEMVGEGDEHGKPDDPAKPRYDAERQSDDDANRQHEQAHRLENEGERVKPFLEHYISEAPRQRPIDPFLPLFGAIRRDVAPAL